MTDEKKTPTVQPLFDQHAETLVTKVVNAEGPGSAAAQAHVFRTLCEHVVPKPASQMKIGAFDGSVQINVTPVD